MIHQVWVNRLDNAIKHIANNGTLKIRLCKVGRDAIFRLEDSGSGMSDETMAHMFDKFYQGDTSHSMAGNGLGLTLVHKIIDLCGGNIEVQIELGRGSIFTIKLPLTNK
ncbi:sensor histidine kinase [Radiobacillus deserti]|uniref:sensor histidine kinase n=1 Tax=Radiobacillus deserti TaxID=2594883 RepID=UPI001E5D5DFC|nr:ATP-binding protein [Radiobacillus deserti]